MQKVNEQAFESILNNGTDIALPESKVTVRIRALPFVTLSRIFSEVVKSLGDAMSSDSRALLESYAGIVAKSDLQTYEEVSSVFKLTIPLIKSIVAQMPSLMNLVLIDVVHGCTMDVARALPAADGLHIINESLEMSDKEAIVEAIHRVFFQATEIREIYKSKRASETKETTE